MYLYEKVGDSLEGRRNIKCSTCGHSKYLEHFDAYTCEHSECKDTTFFKEHTEKNRFDRAVWNGDYKKLRFEKMKYQTKVRISAILNGKR